MAHETQGYEVGTYQDGYSAGHAEGVEDGRKDEAGRVRRALMMLREKQADEGLVDVVAVLDGLIDGLEVGDE